MRVAAAISLDRWSALRLLAHIFQAYHFAWASGQVWWTLIEAPLPFVHSLFSLPTTQATQNGAVHVLAVGVDGTGYLAPTAAMTSAL